MKIVERYPAGLKAFHGKGAWSLLYPLKSFLSFSYGLYIARAGGKGHEGGAGIPGGLGGGRPFVISIGNLEAGGGGKTPVTIALASMIKDNGGSAAVVTRGYGGIAAKEGIPVAIDPCGPGVETDYAVVCPSSHGAEDAPHRTSCSILMKQWGIREESLRIAMTRIVGDEAMIYRSRMIPVVIDSDRNRGTAFAGRLYSPTHVLLDDAFQNSSIAKDLDILLLDAEEPLGNGRLLPAGTLRENPGAITRADVVIFTRSASKDIRRGVGKYIGNKPVFFSSHRSAALVGRDGMEVPFSIPGNRPVAIYSGIARPGSFERTVISTGMEPTVSFRFGDHHWYRREDVDFMSANSPCGAVFVTTEKDWNKSADLFPPGIDLFALRVEAEIGDKEGLLPLIGFGA